MFTQHNNDQNSLKNQAAMIIQGAYRQYRRAIHLHRKPTLFGATSIDTRLNRNRVYLPKEFRHLRHRIIQPLFDHTLHASPHIEKILLDGTIYPGKFCGQKTNCNPKDIERYDAWLACTAPQQIAVSINTNNSIKLSLHNLFQYNDSKGVYFKLIDWESNGEHGPIYLTDDHHLKVSIKYPHHQFSLYGYGKLITIISLPPEECVYHGMSGLDDFLTFFVFKILAAIPEKFDAVRKAIYEHFKVLDQNNAITMYLQTIARQIANRCELDFVQPVKLHLSCIEEITLLRSTYNIAHLKKKLASDNAFTLCNYFNYYPELCHLFSKSYFMTSQLMEYANIVDARNATYYLSMRLLHHTLKETIEHVNHHFLSVIFPREQHAKIIEPYEYANNITVYRPVHGLVHTLRVISYIPHVIDMLQKYGRPDIKMAFEGMDTLKIQKCMLFAVTGRGNENSFYDDQSEYYEFRKLSGQYFYDYFHGKSDFTSDELDHYRHALVSMGEPDNVNPIHLVMNISHKLDLLRCYDFERMETRQVPYLNQFFISRSPVIALLNHAENCIKLTGDRLSCIRQGKQHISRHKSLFVNLSSNSLACMNRLGSKHARFQFKNYSIHDLMKCIVNNNIAGAERIIQYNPLLLTEKCDEVIEPSGFPIKNSTAFQATFRKRALEMMVMIRKYLQPDDLQKQLYDECPDGMPVAPPSFDLTTIIDAINQSSEHDIILALKNIKSDTQLATALETFRCAFHDTIKNETFFNPNHYLQAIILYNSRFPTWTITIGGGDKTTKSTYKHQLFCCQVIGYIQRYMPAWYIKELTPQLGFHYFNLNGMTSSTAPLIISNEDDHSWWDRVHFNLNQEYFDKLINTIIVDNQPTLKPHSC